MEIEESIVLNDTDPSINELYYKADKTNILIYQLSQFIVKNVEFDKLSIISGMSYELSSAQNTYLKLLKNGFNSSLYFKHSSNNISSALLAIASNTNCYTSSIYNGQTTGNDLLGLAAIKSLTKGGSVLAVVSDYGKTRETVNACVALITNSGNAYNKKDLKKTIFLYKTFIWIDESSINEVCNYISDIAVIENTWIIGLDVKNPWHEKFIIRGVSGMSITSIISVDNSTITTGFNIINTIHDKMGNTLIIELESQRLSIIGIRYD